MYESEQQMVLTNWMLSLLVGLKHKFTKLIWTKPAP